MDGKGALVLGRTALVGDGLGVGDVPVSPISAVLPSEEKILWLALKATCWLPCPLYSYVVLPTVPDPETFQVRREELGSKKVSIAGEGISQGTSTQGCRPTELYGCR